MTIQMCMLLIWYMIFDISELLSVFDSESASKDGFLEQSEVLVETILTSLELIETIRFSQLLDVSYTNSWYRLVFETFNLPKIMKSLKEEFLILELKPLLEDLKYTFCAQLRYIFYSNFFLSYFQAGSRIFDSVETTQKSDRLDYHRPQRY